MKRILSLILLLISVTSAKAQTNKPEPEVFDYYFELISDLSQRNEEESDFNEMADELYDLWESPIDINNAETKTFSRLFWLSEFQINSLANYVQANKPIVSLFELAYIPGFDSSYAKSIEPFIVLAPISDSFHKSIRTKQSLLIRSGRVLEKQAGYTDGSLEGNPWKANMRYKFQQEEKLVFGFTLEKDAGETLFKGSNRWGPDFYSGYVMVKNRKNLKTLCFGDFSLGAGQGLVLGPGFSLGKSSQAINIIQKESGIRPYTSTDENRYLRGAALTLGLNSLEVTLFASYKHIDANVLATDTIERTEDISSLQSSGYHASPSEIADENALGEFTTGFRINKGSNTFKLGVSAIHNRFDAFVNPSATNYNQFYFRGKEQTNVGIDYKILLRNTILFGEEAVDQQGDIAIVNGVYSNLYNRFQFSLLHRYYSRAYHAFYGNAFGENSKVQNEEGVYAGMRFPLVKYVNLGLFVDFFRFPWLKYQVDAPSFGKEFMLQAELGSGQAFSGIIQYRYKLKQLNQLGSDSLYHLIGQNTTQRLRLQVSYRISDLVMLNARLETGWLARDGSTSEKSYLLYQDIQLKSPHYPVRLYLRYAMFDTQSYDSRIYAYENDVLYAFTSNAYFNKGQRFCAMIKYEPLKCVDLWIKYSRTLYPQETTISSGSYQINGNSRSDLRLQAIFTF